MLNAATTVAQNNNTNIHVKLNALPVQYKSATASTPRILSQIAAPYKQINPIFEELPHPSVDPFHTDLEIYYRAFDPNYRIAKEMQAVRNEKRARSIPTLVLDSSLVLAPMAQKTQNNLMRGPIHFKQPLRVTNKSPTQLIVPIPLFEFFRGSMDQTSFVQLAIGVLILWLLNRG